MKTGPYTGHVSEVLTDADNNLVHIYIDVEAGQLPAQMRERFSAGTKLDAYDVVKVRARALEVSQRGAGLPCVGAKVEFGAISLVHNDKHLEAQFVTIAQLDQPNRKVGSRMDAKVTAAGNHRQRLNKRQAKLNIRKVHPLRVNKTKPTLSTEPKAQERGHFPSTRGLLTMEAVKLMKKEELLQKSRDERGTIGLHTEVHRAACEIVACTKPEDVARHSSEVFNCLHKANIMAKFDQQEMLGALCDQYKAYEPYLQTLEHGDLLVTYVAFEAWRDYAQGDRSFTRWMHHRIQQWNRCKVTEAAHKGYGNASLQNRRMLIQSVKEKETAQKLRDEAAAMADAQLTEQLRLKDEELEKLKKELFEEWCAGTRKQTSQGIQQLHTTRPAGRRRF